MKLSQNQIEDMILEIAGPGGLPVYKALKGKQNVNEFLIADKLKLTINQIRNILYKFDAYNLVDSTRKKDRKKGWYIYFWTLLPERAEKAVIFLKRQRQEKMQARLEREQSHQFYICPNKDSRMPLETAMEQAFICHECGALLGPDDNRKTINRITKEIDTLTVEIKELEEEARRQALRKIKAEERKEERLKELKAPAKKVAKKAIKKTAKKVAKKFAKKAVKQASKKAAKKSVKKKVLAVASTRRRKK